MQEWYEAGYFHASLLVKNKKNHVEFISLGNLLKLNSKFPFDHNEMLSIKKNNEEYNKLQDKNFHENEMKDIDGKLL